MQYISQLCMIGICIAALNNPSVIFANKNDSSPEFCEAILRRAS